MAKVTKSYGEWVSPITSEVATSNAAVFQALKVGKSPDGKVVIYWSEMRYAEGGRYVIMSCEEGSSDHQQWTPSDYNARTRVHEYGGGDFFVSAGVVYFSNFSDQRLYKQASPESKPTPISTADSELRYADGQLSDKTGMIYIVREDHSKVKSGQSNEATNAVVCINPSSLKETVLVCGADFYSSPRVSSDGKKMCWVQWNHPNMPWDSTEIWTADLSENGELLVDGSATKVAGGKDISTMCPSWNPSGELLYISDETNWWSLYHMSTDGNSTNVFPEDKEVGFPAWMFGGRPYAINANRPEEIVFVLGGKLTVLKDGKTRELDTGFVSHASLHVTDDGTVYCIANSPDKFTSIISVSLSDGKVEVVKQSQTLDVSQSYYSKFTEICYPTADDQVSYAYYYPPQNPDFEAPDGELPPLLVKAHGGPTSQASAALNLKLQYFTSRGFAVLDVNYRGSTGYGRKYRMQLRNKWGVCDIEDCCAGALYLVNQQKADKNRLCIDGGSAGGYTTLACLAFKDVFKAGASHYGVADLELLAKETHKFESRYMDTMIGPYPEQRSVYIERSPLHNVDGLNSPIIFFQGDEDAIVLPNQAELMYKSVNEKKVPCALVMFKGEQHGFRKSENIRLALDGELYFFSKVFGFVAPGLEGVNEKIPISNM